MAKLYFRYSAMNAGKSTALLQVAHNYEEKGKQVRLLTAAIDDRYGSGKITSRLGPQRDAEVYIPTTDLFRVLAHSKVDCVLVDEAQFLSPQQAGQLHRVAHELQIPVICYGLRSDFKGNPFPGAAHLLALADDLEEIKTICGCGRKASMNIRVNEAGERLRHGSSILIGGNGRYQSVCPACFYKSDVPAKAAASPK